MKADNGLRPWQKQKWIYNADPTLGLFLFFYHTTIVVQVRLSSMSCENPTSKDVVFINSGQMFPHICIKQSNTFPVLHVAALEKTIGLKATPHLFLPSVK